MKQHLRGLDGLRGLAAMSVLVYHVSVFAPPPPGGVLADLAGVGWVGVDVFFAISGFILYLPFARAGEGASRSVDLRRYAANRARRILPAYLFNLFVLVSLGVADVLGDLDGLKALASNLTFTAGYLGLPKINGVYWTLFCEVAFYLVLPLLAAGFIRGRWRFGLPVLLGVSWAYKGWAIIHFGPPGARSELRGALEQFPAVLDQFLMGMLAAVLWVAIERRGHRLTRQGALVLSGGSLASIGLVLWLLQEGVGPTAYWAGTSAAGWLPLVVFKPLMSLAAGLAIVGICHRDNAFTRVLELPALRYLGAVSFGVYLWHLPLVHVLAGDHRGDPSLRSFLAALTLVASATLVWSHISHRYVEQPFLRRGGRPPTANEDLVAPTGPAGLRPSEGLSTDGLLAQDRI